MAVRKARTRSSQVFAVALLIHLAAFTYCVLYPEVRYLLDSQEYLNAGKNLFDEGVFYSGDLEEIPRDLSLYSRRPPLYPLVLGLSEAITGSFIPAILLQISLTFLGGYLFWQLLERTHIESTFFLALYLLYPAQIMYSQFLMAEILLQFLILFATFLFFRFLESQRLVFLTGMNLAIGISALCKPVMMLFWLPNIVFHLWMAFRFARTRVVIIGFIPLLVFAGWGYRNQKVTGYFHFTSMTASQSMLMSRESREAGQQEDDFARASQAAVQTYVTTVLNNFPRYARAYATGMMAFFLDPGRFDFYEFLNWSHDVRLPLIFFLDRPEAGSLAAIPWPILFLLTIVFLVNCLILLGLLYAPFNRNMDPLFRGFVFLLLFYMAALVGPIGTSRYRLSVEPLLLILAAPAVCLTFSYLKRQWKRT